MRKSGVDANNVKMSDVLCDFCRREWTEDVAMIEGHHGSCICGNCLRMAYLEVVLHGAANCPREGYNCPMCLEVDDDRAALDRGGEPGWRSPVIDDAAICRRCIKLAAGALHKDPDNDWTKPVVD